MNDKRPTNCRFRLQDEGMPYPKSACQACGKTIATGLGKFCHYTNAMKIDVHPTPKSDETLDTLKSINKQLELIVIELQRIGKRE